MRKYILSLSIILIAFGCKKDIDTPVDPPDPPPPPQIATVVTHPYAKLTRFSVHITGTITDTGDSKVTEAGFVLDTVGNSTITKHFDKFVCVPDSSGKMLVIITDILPAETFYLRAYAKNAQGVAYGNEIVLTTLSEKVFTGDVTLTTQEEVVEFGSKSYNRITGGLEIRGTVTDLAPLKDLVVIDRGLIVRYTGNLVSLKGLDSLEIVNADAYSYRGILVQDNTSLKDLIGLDKLTGNKGELSIINNDALKDLTGLNNIISNSSGDIRVEGCAQITSLHGIENFELLDGSVLLKDNPLLVDISAFSKLRIVTERIRIYNNDLLENVNGFEKIHILEGIELFDNDLLSDLVGFSNVEKIASGLVLNNNASLAELKFFKKLTTIPYLTIENSPGFKSLRGLENLKVVTGNLLLSNTGITDMKGLDTLEWVQMLQVFNNEKLVNFQGLSNLNTIAIGFAVTRNNSLVSVSGLNKLRSAGTQMQFAYNPLLVQFCDLKPLFTGGWNGVFIVDTNGANPTKAEILSSCP